MSTKPHKGRQYYGRTPGRYWVAKPTSEKPKLVKIDRISDTAIFTTVPSGGLVATSRKSVGVWATFESWRRDRLYHLKSRACGHMRAAIEINERRIPFTRSLRAQNCKDST